MDEREINLVRIKDLDSGDSSLIDITLTNNEIPVDSVSNGTKKLKLRNIAGKIINYITTHIASILGAPNAVKFLGSDQYGNLVWKDTPAQENADWNATEGAAKILNKPSLKTVATTGEYSDLLHKPEIPAAQIQSDWEQLNSSAVDYIKNKPNLHSVATSGNYNELNNKPEIPAAQIQSDWTQTTTTAKDYIKNKPNLHSVATSGNYTELNNKPTSLSDFENDPGYQTAEDVEGIIEEQGFADVAYSGSYADLDGTPDLSDFATKSGDIAAINLDIAAINAKIVAIGKPLKWIAALPPSEIEDLEDVEEGSVYTCTEDGTIDSMEVTADEEVAWNGEEWFSIGKGNIDLSNYYTKDEVDALLPDAQIQSDWTQSDSDAKDFIKNKPTLAAVATSGAYSDLSGTPTIPDAQIQSDWSQADDTKKDYIKNKPSLAAVATSGDYGDLANTPTIPDAQIQSDWTQADDTKKDYIKNKPSLAAVATSGAYSDLSGTPTIPDAPVQSDWEEDDNTEQSFIKNKPNLADVATSGDYTDLSNTPHIPVIGYEEL